MRLLALAAIFGWPQLSAAATIHVDSGLAGDCVGTYDAATRSCGGGSGTAYSTVKGAAAAAQAGDTVLLRGGVYQEALVPPRSGASDRPISFKGYPGENAALTVVDAPAIFLSGRSYLVIEGLTVTDSLGWGRVENSTYNVIRDNRFARALARGTTGGLKFVKSAYNRVIGNTFEEGNDSLVLQESDRNLLQANTFITGRHSLVSVRCGNFNVIRANRFHNPDQKAGEIYDCEGVSDAPVKLDATKHNLFDGNAFTYTRASSRDYGRYNGIQYSGQNGIVRRNVFYDNRGGALNFAVYAKEALYNNQHRVYNNTFYNNGCYGMASTSAHDPKRYFGTIVKNNIFYRNVDCGGGATQTLIGNSKAVKLENNAIIKTSPLFADEAGRDLHLTAGSPMIDAGAFATRAAGAGSGTVLAVEDVGYFYDGFGIPEEVGDMIQLEGQTATARIVRIDYAAGTLILDRPLTWTAGQNVHLQYSGTRPDFGAYEFTASSTTSPPGNPAVVR